MIQSINRRGDTYMDFWTRVKSTVDKGLSASKDLFGKAGEAARELGEKGVLRIEVRELENRVKDLLQALGLAVFQQLDKEGKASVTAKNQEIAELIQQIKTAESEITLREQKLEELKNLHKQEKHGS